MNKIIATLNHIKNNPDCDSHNLDFNIVYDLHKSGYIEGINTSTYDGNSFISLRINIQGVEYLKLVERPPSKPNNSMDNSSKVIYHWYKKPIGLIGIGVATIIIGAFAVDLLKHIKSSIE